jgi:asparagine synthase (glutamine-hydrolysing)
MCGIAAIAGLEDRGAIHAMTRSLAHRGPDGEGYYFDRELALGHRRLSVIDPEGGRQPMTTQDGRFILAFNGEIYNFRELRRELEATGWCFRTRSDTEVLLASWAAWGREALEKLRGMFAFAVWDRDERSLFAARDRLGLKPLYWTEAAGGLLLASEMKGLLAHPLVDRALDLTALDDFLTYLYVPAPKTIFRGIHELPPAHWLEWRPGRGSTSVRIGRYWDVRFDPRPVPLGESVEALQALLQEAVSLRLESDVPLGVFLSGGLDSSTILAVAARRLSEPVRAFTLDFPGSRYSELAQARRVAQAVGAASHELTLPSLPPSLEDPEALLSEVTRHFDEPFGNPTSLLIYQLSRLSRRQVTVALVGDGGDEVLLGYPRYRGAVLADRCRHIPEPLRRLAARGAAHLSEPGDGNHFNRRLREFAAGACQPPDRMYFDWVSYFPLELRRRLYRPQLALELSDYDSSAFLLDLFRHAPAADFIDRINYVDLHSFLPCNLLRYTDRMSMAHGLEIRAPFTDHRLIEFLTQVPWRHKLRGSETKFLLRRAAASWVPRQVLRRSKLGLNPPMGLWLRGYLRPLLDEYLSTERLRRRGYFRPETVREIIRDHLDGRRDYSLHLWALVSFEAWHRQYLDSKPEGATTPSLPSPTRVLNPLNPQLALV